MNNLKGIVCIVVESTIYIHIEPGIAHSIRKVSETKDGVLKRTVYLDVISRPVFPNDLDKDSSVYLGTNITEAKAKLLDRLIEKNTFPNVDYKKMKKSLLD